MLVPPRAELDAVAPDGGDRRDVAGLEGLEASGQDEHIDRALAPVGGSDARSPRALDGRAHELDIVALVRQSAFENDGRLQPKP
jgi:hypothetical protein